ncbi:hypothetical protein llap_17934 [Limosa lapponica baueri]|uniref:Uncharacterized protein n=1 Tax=Limosa lapponica baueri TaxID=1758121 RepID=A0A2I0TDB2_LIMLA|nr:hypothetical protein llap_17934 [Limosa lapponica baueri]
MTFGGPFRNSLIDTWSKELGVEWVCHIPYHAPAFGKIERSLDLASFYGETGFQKNLNYSFSLLNHFSLVAPHDDVIDVL